MNRHLMLEPSGSDSWGVNCRRAQAGELQCTLQLFESAIC